jgi:hypothetical protein
MPSPLTEIPGAKDVQRKVFRIEQMVGGGRATQHDIDAIFA